MNSWHSYPTIYNLGHAAVAGVLAVPVNVEEKIDGSQFSFGVTEEGELKVRSKGANLHADAPERMFQVAVDSVKSRLGLLHPGWTYRGEYLTKPKHNTLAYERTPNGNIIIFDINDGEESYLPYHEKVDEATRIGLEVVPLMFPVGSIIETAAKLRSALEVTSILGGQKIEGVVVKPTAYGLFGVDKKVLFGKFVSEAFKEVHGGEWRKNNPIARDVVDLLVDRYRTPARWSKAVIHLAERGEITDSPRDIGKLIPEVADDIEKECSEEIRDALYTWAWPQLRRRVAHGLAEWYKDELLKKQFGEVE